MQTIRPVVPRFHQVLFLGGFSLGQTLIARAEATVPALVGVAPEKETTTLSPVKVRAEQGSGWVGSSTLVGTRPISELSEGPMTVDDVSPEFIKDLVAYTTEDAIPHGWPDRM